MSQFSEALKAARKNAGKKQREAAEHLGINLRTYQYYEEGRSEPSVSGLIMLANFFQVSLDELVGREWE